MRKFKGIFTSVIDLKVKLMEEFEDQVPPTTHFSVGYFEGWQSTKKWLASQDDLTAMYSSLKKSGKTYGVIDAVKKLMKAQGNARGTIVLVLNQNVLRKRKKSTTWQRR